MEANSTGGQGSPRAVALSDDDDDDDDDDCIFSQFITTLRKFTTQS